MPINIEIKAKARDLERQQTLAAALATEPPQSLDQVDTFFHAPSGRLKLRQLAKNFGQLIHYSREDIAGPKSSTFSIFPTTDPASLRDLLSAALGIHGEVRKHRTVYLAGQTRIHLDQVEGLGVFIELEVVLRPDLAAEEGRQIARHIMQQLDIRDEDLIDRAYLDLIIGSA